MKTLYILSAIAIFNLLAVTALANSPMQKNLIAQKTSMTEVLPTIVPTPTPVVVIKQVIKKVTKFATTAPSANNKIATTTTATTQTQNQAQPSQATSQPAAQQPAPAPVPSGCIITLDGSSYNVTNLQRTHSGGDIFNCGSDMSATFWGKHGQSIFNKMQQYRI